MAGHGGVYGHVKAVSNRRCLKNTPYASAVPGTAADCTTLPHPAFYYRYNTRIQEGFHVVKYESPSGQKLDPLIPQGKEYSIIAIHVPGFGNTSALALHFQLRDNMIGVPKVDQITVTHLEII